MRYKFFPVFVCLGCIMSFIISCKKKGDEVQPSSSPLTVAVSDTFDMRDPETVKILDVLANDHYTGSVELQTSNLNFPWGFFLDTNSTVVYITTQNAYGLFSSSYSITDQNGKSTANVTVRRGTEAQMQASEFIAKVSNMLGVDIENNTKVLVLYAVDGDTSYFYHNSNEAMKWTQYSKLLLSSQLFPNISSDPNVDFLYLDTNYRILEDGTVSAKDDQGAEIEFKIEGLFSAVANNPQDQSQTLEVSGITIVYGGHVLDYVLR